MKLTAPPSVDNYEIERRVAVEVMGLPQVDWGLYAPCPYCREVGHSGMGRKWCSNCQEWYYHPYKNYRDSLDDAMEILDKADGLWELRRYPEVKNEGDENTEYATFYSCDLRFGDKLGSASGCASAPEAICLAALNAVSSGLHYRRHPV